MGATWRYTIERRCGLSLTLLYSNLFFFISYSPHSTTPTSTPTPTRRTRVHPYVRHARFPREDVGVGVVECGLIRTSCTFIGRAAVWFVDAAYVEALRRRFFGRRSVRGVRRLRSIYYWSETTSSAYLLTYLMNVSRHRRPIDSQDRSRPGSSSRQSTTLKSRDCVTWSSVVRTCDGLNHVVVQVEQAVWCARVCAFWQWFLN